MKQSFYIPKSHFTANDIPDLSGKVIIVTGGNEETVEGASKLTSICLLFIV